MIRTMHEAGTFHPRGRSYLYGVPDERDPSRETSQDIGEARFAALRAGHYKLGRDGKLSSQNAGFVATIGEARGAAMRANLAMKLGTGVPTNVSFPSPTSSTTPDVWMLPLDGATRAAVHAFELAVEEDIGV